MFWPIIIAILRETVDTKGYLMLLKICFSMKGYFVSTVSLRMAVIVSGSMSEK